MLAVEIVVTTVVLLIVAFAAGRGWRGLDDEPEQRPDTGLAAGRLLRSDDIGRLRFRVTLRGYRMSDVDEALEAVERTLQAHEAHLLHGDAPEPETGR